MTRHVWDTKVNKSQPRRLAEGKHLPGCTVQDDQVRLAWGTLATWIAGFTVNLDRRGALVNISMGGMVAYLAFCGIS